MSSMQDETIQYNFFVLWNIIDDIEYLTVKYYLKMPVKYYKNG